MKDSQPVTHFLSAYTPPNYLVRTTDLDVHLFDDGARVISTLRLSRHPQAPANAPLVLDGVELKLEKVRLNGENLSSAAWRQEEEQLILEAVPVDFELEITTWILPQENTCLEGLYRSGTMFCTQCEAEGFRRITYFPDRPDVMSIYTVRIEADHASYPVLLSNGNPVAEGVLDHGRHYAVWEDPFPKPSYLFALVAGDLKHVSDHFQTASGKEVELRIYVEPENLGKCDHAMASLKRSMRWDEERYGREYDLERFNIVAVSHFNMGAMENKGLNIFNSACVLASPETATDVAFERIEAIVAHEYFHNWSGNRVTCRDWFQLSLKEGFTVFRDASYTADRYGHAVKRIDDAVVMRTAQFAEDASPMAHPIRPDSYMEISNFYTLTVYEKGAEVVGMIHRLLGPAQFRKGSDLYFDRFDGQAVTTDDFVACMEEASGRDLSQFKRWYSQAGTPVLDIKEGYDAAGQRYTLHIAQSCPPTPGQATKAPFHIPVEIALFDPSGQQHALPASVLELREPEQTFTFEGISRHPIPALLRHFSAPVKVRFDYGRERLAFLMAHDTDGFSRWDAGHTLALDVLLELIGNGQALDTVELDASYLQAWTRMAADSQIEDGLHARMLQIPGVALLVEKLEKVDLDRVLAVRRKVVDTLVHAAAEQLVEQYHALHALEQRSAASLEPAAMGRRALRNQILTLLAETGTVGAAEIIRSQYESARLMTDEEGALFAAVRLPERRLGVDLVERFEQRWTHDPLVMETWFSVQAGSAAYTDLAGLRALLEHPAFSKRNPNKVRSVIGSFIGQNWAHFHAADGSGYALLGDWILTMDALNPQIASRLVTPLTRWRKYDGARGTLMRDTLQRVLTTRSLSRDVFEVVHKSLQD